MTDKSKTPEQIAALKAERDRLRALVKDAHDLIKGDAVGLEWKSRSNNFVKNASAALADTQEDYT